MKLASHRVVAGIAVLALAGLGVTDAEAQRSGRFSSDKTFGLGLMIGAPTGLSGKYYLSSSTAIDFGVGVVRYYRHRRSNLHLHADFLWHPLNLVSVAEFDLPLYFGIGGRAWDFDDGDRDDPGFGLGVRVPLGVAFDFNTVPLDAFVEIALVVDFFFDYYDEYGADLNAAIGVRYYFN